LAKQEEISKINCRKFNQTNEKEEKNKNKNNEKKMRTKLKKEKRKKSITLMTTIPPTPTTSHHCQNHPTTYSLHLRGV
jgi:hypothetical protein